MTDTESSMPKLKVVWLIIWFQQNEKEQWVELRDATMKGQEFIHSKVILAKLAWCGQNTTSLY